jgi:hypothetical protein
MGSLLVHRILVDGVALSAVAISLIFGSLRWNPRLWLQDFPKDIRDAVPPKTPGERRQSLVWGIPFLAVLFLAPFLSCRALIRDAGAPVSLAWLWVDAFGMAIVFNLVDLVVVDWLVVCTITPSFLVVPGTVGFAGYKDYRHHVRAFVTGTVASTVIAAIAAGAAGFF